MATERHTAAFVVGIAVGGLLGAGYVLFKTPRSGREVRDQILGRFRGVVDAVTETADVVGVETRRAGEQVAGRIEHARDAVTDRLTGLPVVPGPHDTPEAVAAAAEAAGIPASAPPAPVPPVDSHEAVVEPGDLAAAEAAAAIDPLEAVEPLAQGTPKPVGPNGVAPSPPVSTDEVSSSSRSTQRERLDPGGPGG